MTYLACLPFRPYLPFLRRAFLRKAFHQQVQVRGLELAMEQGQKEPLKMILQEQENYFLLLELA
jgi:hypothetical protein